MAGPKNWGLAPMIRREPPKELLDQTALPARHAKLCASVPLWQSR